MGAMARLTKEQKRKIKKLEQEIKEEESLWEKIKAIPEQDKLFPKRFRDMVKSSKRTRKKLPKAIKQRVNKTFWGLEPPTKPKKKSKKK